MKKQFTRRDLLRGAMLGIVGLPFMPLFASKEQRTFAEPAAVPYLGSDDALLDEIERLVPGYALDRVNLFSGSDVHSEAAAPQGFVPVSALTGHQLIAPSHDGLFTSATLGRYSSALCDLEQHQAEEVVESAAD